MKTAVEDYANDRGISNDEAFNEIKDFYEHAQENPRTIEDQVSKIENDMEQMRADYERDMKSQDESLATMEEPTTTETFEEVVSTPEPTKSIVKDTTPRTADEIQIARFEFDAEWNKKTKTWDIPKDKKEAWDNALDTIRNDSLTFSDYLKSKPKVDRPL